MVNICYTRIYGCLDLIKKKDYEIISLGISCIPTDNYLHIYPVTIILECFYFEGSNSLSAHRLREK